MIRLLIVDDQIYVANGIQGGICWEQLGITEVYTAYSAFEARRVFSSHPIDIMLCDIEMPVENGISLYRWVKAEGYATECIFLTAHADFSYAQEAVRLNSFDYILQPARYEEIQSAVARAVNRIRAQREMNRYSAYGQTMYQNKTSWLNAVFQDCLTGRKESFAAACQGMEELEVSLKKGQDLVCLLLQPLAWAEGQQCWDNGTLYYAQQNILSEIFAPYHCACLLMCAGEEIYVVIYHQEGGLLKREELQRQLELFLETCQKKIGLSLACYVSEVAAEGDLANQVELLRKREADNVALEEGIFFSHPGQETETPPRFEPQMKQWKKMLLDGNAVLVKEEIHTWLDQRSQAKQLSAQGLKLFYQSLVQMMSMAAEQKGIRLQKYLQESEILDKYLQAYRSVDDMKSLIDYVIPCFQQAPPEESERQIDRVLQYIYDHLEDDIKRTDIAKEVFLNPDYLSRMFKKETGVSLKEFIITEKMKLAKSLLTGTNLPIGTIALRVGYGNFSHFSQSYKKVMGVTPEEQRKK